MVETASQRKRRLGIAAGVIAARCGVSGDRAYEMLRLASWDSHRNLDDAAEDAIITGALGTDERCEATANRQR
jgi:AmiR/NasT family two-component response regulator